MIDLSVLSSIARQLTGGDEVEVGGSRRHVGRTSGPTPENGDLHARRARVRGHRAETR